MLESEIQNKMLLRYGSDARLKIWRNNTGAAETRDGRLVRFGLPGQGDVTGIVRGCGTRFECENKTATGRQSEAQKNFERMIISAGGIYVLNRSESGDDVERSLREHVTVCPLCSDG